MFNTAAKVTATQKDRVPSTIARLANQYIKPGNVVLLSLHEDFSEI